MTLRLHVLPARRLLIKTGKNRQSHQKTGLGGVALAIARPTSRDCEYGNDRDGNGGQGRGGTERGHLSVQCTNTSHSHLRIHPPSTPHTHSHTHTLPTPPPCTLHLARFSPDLDLRPAPLRHHPRSSHPRICQCCLAPHFF